jgi:hypothetical protein
MDLTVANLLDEVRPSWSTVLGIQDRAASLDAGTELLGSLPELDSPWPSLELIAALEQRFASPSTTTT